MAASWPKRSRENAINSALIARLGGLAVGWSYAEIRASLPPRPWTALAVFALVAATLTPAIVLAQLRPPPLNVSTGAILDGSSPGVVIVRVVLERLLTATLAGGLAGWWLWHTARAASQQGWPVSSLRWGRGTIFYSWAARRRWLKVLSC